MAHISKKVNGCVGPVSKKKGRLVQPPFLGIQETQGLPAEFDHHLHYAVANRVCSVPEIGVCQSPATVKRNVQILVAVEESAIRVVEEVIAGEPELELFILRRSESEILEQRQVSITEPRTRQYWENVVTLFAGRSERREAGAQRSRVRAYARRVVLQPLH